jgi:hypothetical protein
LEEQWIADNERENKIIKKMRIMQFTKTQIVGISSLINLTLGG